MRDERQLVAHVAKELRCPSGCRRGIGLSGCLPAHAPARILAPMPGSGPIDPTVIWNAIHGGATYSGGLLDGQHLRVATSGAWELTSQSALTLAQNGYAKLAAGTIANGYLVVGTTRYKLAPVGGTADAVLA